MTTLKNEKWAMLCAAIADTCDSLDHLSTSTWGWVTNLSSKSLLFSSPLLSKPHHMWVGGYIYMKVQWKHWTTSVFRSGREVGQVCYVLGIAGSSFAHKWSGGGHG